MKKKIVLALSLFAVFSVAIVASFSTSAFAGSTRYNSVHEDCSNTCGMYCADGGTVTPPKQL